MLLRRVFVLTQAPNSLQICVTVTSGRKGHYFGLLKHACIPVVAELVQQNEAFARGHSGQGPAIVRPALGSQDGLLCSAHALRH